MPVSGANSIIDIYHGNTVQDFAAVQADGITAVIHKATEGTFFQDPAYFNRKAAATALGLLWGCYHFSSGEDPVAQADYFVDYAKPGANELIAIDCEPSSVKGGVAMPNMTFAQLDAFITQVQNRLGRAAVIYGGDFLRGLMQGNGGGPINLSPLWFSQYPNDPNASSPTAPLPDGWTTWTLWQYTGDGNGPSPKQVAGIAGYCDRDTYNGPSGDLATHWPFT